MESADRSIKMGQSGNYLHVQDSKIQNSLTPTTHHRTDSSYSNSYSLLDIYRTDSPAYTQDEEELMELRSIDTHNSLNFNGSSPDKKKDSFTNKDLVSNQVSDAVKELNLMVPLGTGKGEFKESNESNEFKEFVGTGGKQIEVGIPRNIEVEDPQNNHLQETKNTVSPASTSTNSSNFQLNSSNSTTQKNCTPPTLTKITTRSQNNPSTTDSPRTLNGTITNVPTSNRKPSVGIKLNSPEIPTKRSNYIEPLSSDTIAKLLDSPFDRYGFKKASTHHDITKDEYNSWFGEYAEFSIRRKQKWHALMKSNGLGMESGELANPKYDGVPSRFPPKSDKVKKMVRRGIPAEWRGNAWFFYAGGNEKLNKHVGVYEQIVRDTRGIHNKDTEVIERDLNRTFPDNIYFNELITSTSIEEGSEMYMITALRRVLIAFAHYQPQIGYCQSLNFLAGLLLLFMDEERAFWMLVILTERIIPKVHSANLEGVHTDQGVLMLCIKEYIPQLWAILGKTFEGETLSEDKILSTLPPVTLVTSSWFMSLFVGNLPIETVLRVWDIVWYEGSKTIFRISLTICRMCLDNPDFQNARNINGGAERDQIELFQFMQNFPKIILDPNFLIDNCFKKIGGYGYGSLSQDEINKCREFVSKQRAKLDHKKNSIISAELTDEERRSLVTANSENYIDQDIHDVYGFRRPIMSGMVWNKNVSNKMKKKFARRPSK